MSARSRLGIRSRTPGGRCARSPRAPPSVPPWSSPPRPGPPRGPSRGRPGTRPPDQAGRRPRRRAASQRHHDGAGDRADDRDAPDEPPDAALLARRLDQRSRPSAGRSPTPRRAAAACGRSRSSCGLLRRRAASSPWTSRPVANAWRSASCSSGSCIALVTMGRTVSTSAAARSAAADAVPLLLLNMCPPSSGRCTPGRSRAEPAARLATGRRAGDAERHDIADDGLATIDHDRHSNAATGLRVETPVAVLRVCARRRLPAMHPRRFARSPASRAVGLQRLHNASTATRRCPSASTHRRRAGARRCATGSPAMPIDLASTPGSAAPVETLDIVLRDGRDVPRRGVRRPRRRRARRVRGRLGGSTTTGPGAGPAPRTTARRAARAGWTC